MRVEKLALITVLVGTTTLTSLMLSVATSVGQEARSLRGYAKTYQEELAASQLAVA